MIKPNELRIGNIIYSRKGIYGASSENLMLKIDEDYMEVLMGARDYQNIDPIPLTSEILEQCGFEKNGSIYAIGFKNGNTLQITGNNVFLGGEDSCIDAMGFNTDIHFLHQLQNLYFALTGEELKIKSAEFA